MNDARPIQPPSPARADLRAAAGARVGYLGQLLIVAAGYIVAGRLGLLLALPPGYAAPVWPAAGLALAALLLGGPRLWPGVFLGSLIVNLPASWDPAASAPLLNGLGLAATIASGAVLQAVVAATLIRRYVPDRNLLVQEAGTIRLLLLGGPVACVISASIGVSCLWQAGKIPVSALAFNWWTWWVGDSIGVVLFTPLALVWLQRGASRHQQLLVTLPLTLMFALMVALFFFVSQREDARIQSQLELDAERSTQRLEGALENYLGIVSSLQSFYASSELVTAEEFRSFSSRLVGLLPGVRALYWAERVPDTEREAYVARVRGEGLADFEIRDAAGPAPPAAEHVVLRYIEPLAANGRALGFDLLSEPHRRAALQMALQTGEAVATSPVALVQDPQQRPAVVAALPVFAHGEGRAQDWRLANVTGYVGAVFVIDDIVREAFGALEDEGLRYNLFDITDDVAGGVILNERGRFDARAEGVRRVRELHWAGRHWQLEFFLSAQYLVSHRSRQAWWLMATGLLFTGLLGMLLLVIIGRQARVEALVASQTAEIRRGEERFRGLLENTPDAMVIVNRAGLIEFANEQAVRLFGHDRAELLGQPVEMLIPESLRAGHVRHRDGYFGAPARRPMGAGIPLRARRRDGSEFPVEISLGPVSFGGELSVTATVRDISARMLVQNQLAQYADNLKRSNDELEQFAYVASRDLKAPLRGVIGFSQLLQRRLGEQRDDDAREYLQHIIASGQHMQNLISDLLLFARVGRGEDSARVAVDAEDVLAEAQLRLRSLIDECGAQLSHEPLPRVMATRTELLQLLQNLLSNAIKFQPGERPRVHLSAQREGECWRIGVRDYGIGIPADQQQRIFKIFQRLHSAEQYEGTGVGLAICQKIVQRHGGRIWAESEPGRGSIFYFTLHAAADAAA